MKRFLIIITAIILAAGNLSAQKPLDRSEVRSGVRQMKKGNLKEAEIDFRRALVKDSTSFAANYDLASTIYSMNKGDQRGVAEAAKFMEAIQEQAAADPQWGDEYFFNLGDMAIEMQDWKTAVEAFRQSLLRNPGDLDAKENYIYAKKKLQDQQNQEQNQDQNQDNQDNQNQDQNQDQNNQGDGEDQKDQNKDQNNNDQNQDNNQDQNQNQNQNQDQKDSGQQPQESQLSPQAAQQLLQAIQDKEKETQEKVKAEKAAAMKSKQKVKNW